MVIPSTGQLSLLDIATEFGGTVPHAINEYYAKASGIPSAGIIAFSDFRGKSAATNPVWQTASNLGSANAGTTKTATLVAYNSAGNTNNITYTIKSSPGYGTIGSTTGSFSASIPSGASTSTVSWTITATDTANNLSTDQIFTLSVTGKPVWGSTSTLSTISISVLSGYPQSSARTYNLDGFSTDTTSYSIVSGSIRIKGSSGATLSSVAPLPTGSMTSSTQLRLTAITACDQPGYEITMRATGPAGSTDKVFYFKAIVDPTYYIMGLPDLYNSASRLYVSATANLSGGATSAAINVYYNGNNLYNQYTQIPIDLNISGLSTVDVIMLISGSGVAFPVRAVPKINGNFSLT